MAFTAAMNTASASLSDRLPPPLGQPGFELPILADYELIEISGPDSVHALERTGITVEFGRTKEPEAAPSLTIYRSREAFRRNLKFHLGAKASNNLYIMEQGFGLEGHIHLHGSGNIVIDRGSARQRGRCTIAMWEDEGVFYWGSQSSSNGFAVEFDRYGRHVLIGHDCMFASDIVLRPSDLHAVMDFSTRTVPNLVPGETAAIVLFPHVWVGHRVTILKNVTIGPGSIVGAQSVVTRSVAGREAVAGNPARVVRQNCSWSRSKHATEADFTLLDQRLTEFDKVFAGFAAPGEDRR
jgi:acetyltransferase-like isoleucine patch superfamily enzyme